MRQGLPKTIRQQKQLLEETLGNSDDIVYRPFLIGANPKHRGLLVFVDGMVDKETVNTHILNALTYNTKLDEDDPLDFGAASFNRIKNGILTIGAVKVEQDFEQIVKALLSGDSIILLEGFAKALIASTRGYATRGIQEPSVENTVRGPREAFDENIRTSTSLVRRRIKDPGLRFETLELGKVTKTTVMLGYIKQIVNPKTLAEVKERLGRIEVDSILDAGYVQEFIDDNPYSPLPTVYYTEKADTVAGKLLEGRIAIFVDGSPTCLTVPAIFPEFLMSSEDYYNDWYYASFSRWLRVFGILTSLILPAFWVAMVSFNQDMMPTQLLLTLAKSREGIPFPAIMENLLMGLTFEVLREAGIRMPRPVGQAVSIVGSLVIGQAAVEAGLVGTPMVVITALAGISIFVIPSHELAVALIPFRLFLTLMAGFMGMFGLSIALLVMLAYLVGLRSYGIPYMFPLAPTSGREQKDTLIRAPWWAMNLRPELLVGENKVRQANNLRPSYKRATKQPPKASFKQLWALLRRKF